MLRKKYFAACDLVPQGLLYIREFARSNWSSRTYRHSSKNASVDLFSPWILWSVQCFASSTLEWGSQLCGVMLVALDKKVCVKCCLNVPGFKNPLFSVQEGIKNFNSSFIFAASSRFWISVWPPPHSVVATYRVCGNEWHSLGIFWSSVYDEQLTCK